MACKLDYKERLETDNPASDRLRGKAAGAVYLSFYAGTVRNESFPDNTIFQDNNQALLRIGRGGTNGKKLRVEVYFSDSTGVSVTSANDLKENNINAVAVHYDSGLGDGKTVYVSLNGATPDTATKDGSASSWRLGYSGSTFEICNGKSDTGTLTELWAGQMRVWVEADTPSVANLQAATAGTTQVSTLSNAVLGWDLITSEWDSGNSRFNSLGSYTSHMRAKSGTTIDPPNDITSNRLVPVFVEVAWTGMGDAPATIIGAVVVTGGISPFTYEVDWGDGGGYESSSSSPSHFYSTSGNRNVVFRVTDSASSQSTYSRSIRITDNGGYRFTVIPKGQFQAGLSTGGYWGTTWALDAMRQVNRTTASTTGDVEPVNAQGHAVLGAPNRDLYFLLFRTRGGPGTPNTYEPGTYVVYYKGRGKIKTIDFNAAPGPGVTLPITTTTFEGGTEGFHTFKFTVTTPNAAGVRIIYENTETFEQCEFHHCLPDGVPLSDARKLHPDFIEKMRGYHIGRFLGLVNEFLTVDDMTPDDFVADIRGCDRKFGGDVASIELLGLNTNYGLMKYASAENVWIFKVGLDGNVPWASTRPVTMLGNEWTNKDNRDYNDQSQLVGYDAGDDQTYILIEAKTNVVPTSLGTWEVEYEAGPSAAAIAQVFNDCNLDADLNMPRLARDNDAAMDGFIAKFDALLKPGLRRGWEGSNETWNYGSRVFWLSFIQDSGYAHEHNLSGPSEAYAILAGKLFERIDAARAASGKPWRYFRIYARQLPSISTYDTRALLNCRYDKLVGAPYCDPDKGSVGTTYSAGDVIIYKDGDGWRHGAYRATSGHTLTDALDPRDKVSQDVTGWSAETGRYSASLSLPTGRVIRMVGSRTDKRRLTLVADAATVSTTNNSWYWNSATETLYVRVGSNDVPSENPTDEHPTGKIVNVSFCGEDASTVWEDCSEEADGLYWVQSFSQTLETTYGWMRALRERVDDDMEACAGKILCAMYEGGIQVSNLYADSPLYLPLYAAHSSEEMGALYTEYFTRHRGTGPSDGQADIVSQYLAVDPTMFGAAENILDTEAQAPRAYSIIALSDPGLVEIPDTLTLGESTDLYVRGYGDAEAVDIELSRNGGVDWETVVEDHDPTTPYSWTPTGAASFDCVLRVVRSDDDTRGSQTLVPFALLPEPYDPFSVSGAIEANTGALWVKVSGNTISSDGNYATGGIQDAMYHWNDPRIATDKQWTEVEIPTALSSSSAAGTFSGGLRLHATARSGYAGYYFKGVGMYWAMIARIDNGTTISLLGSVLNTDAPPIALRLEADGTQIKLKKKASTDSDWVTISTVTDSTYATGKVGLISRHPLSGFFLDSWKAGTLE